jgi:hypothetical protein
MANADPTALRAGERLLLLYEQIHEENPGMSQNVVASTKMGIHSSAISQQRTGGLRASIGMKTIGKVSRAVGIDPKWFSDAWPRGKTPSYHKYKIKVSTAAHDGAELTLTQVRDLLEELDASTQEAAQVFSKAEEYSTTGGFNRDRVETRIKTMREIAGAAPLRRASDKR